MAVQISTRSTQRGARRTSPQASAGATFRLASSFARFANLDDPSCSIYADNGDARIDGIYYLPKPTWLDGYAVFPAGERLNVLAWLEECAEARATESGGADDGGMSSRVREWVRRQRREIRDGAAR
jgi:hypothetical protein